MKKTLMICMGLVLLASCGEQLQLDYKQMSEDNSYDTQLQYLLSGQIAVTAKYWQEYGEKEDQFTCPTQYVVSLQGQGSNVYDSFNYQWGDWNNEYVLLKNLQTAATLSKEKNRLAYHAVFEVLSCFMWAHVTNIFGDVPYSEAVKGRFGITKPKYDPQKTIYEDLFKRLGEATAILESTGDVMDFPNFDLLYGGNKAKWVKFANSLKLRLYVKSYEAFKKAGVDNGIKIAELAGGGKIILTNADNASFAYGGTNTTDSWPQGPLRLTGGNADREFQKRKPSSTLVNVLKGIRNPSTTVVDPRLKAWIAPAKAPLTSETTRTESATDSYGNSYQINWWPKTGIPEEPVWPYDFDNFYCGSPVGDQAGANVLIYGNTDINGGFQNTRISDFTNQYRKNADAGKILRLTMIAADEVNMLLAEARFRGWITSGTTDSYFRTAIQLNCDRWAVPTAESTPFVGGFSAVTNIEQINVQKWLLLYGVACEAYTDIRRTNPAFLKTEADRGGITLPYPQRFRYPTDEKTNNRQNYDAASTAIGGDNQDAKVWIMK